MFQFASLQREQRHNFPLVYISNEHIQPVPTERNLSYVGTLDSSGNITQLPELRPKSYRIRVPDEKNFGREILTLSLFFTIVPFAISDLTNITSHGVYGGFELSSVSIVMDTLRRLQRNQNNIAKNAVHYKRVKDDRARRTNSRSCLAEGFVYCLSNPIFPGWVKIGSCIDMDERLAMYQNADPLRRYKVETYRFVDDRVQTESKLHKLFAANRGSGEWFHVDAETIRQSLLYDTSRINRRYDDKGNFLG